ncbi:MAG: GNAT family N-acetyltransferase [Candidatus Omnitrophica bacterium]|nr:GNAT family N-acetyltransferase [Candidatus Omnitrophota bacterium]
MLNTTNEYLKISLNSGIFNDNELDALKEILEAYEQNPGKDYFLFEERQGSALLGFLIFGKSSLTHFSWDIYRLVVDKDFLEQPIAEKLLARLEDFILKDEKKAILRVETSTKEACAHARELYEQLNFQEGGRIPSFYDDKEDLIVYYKPIGITMPEDLLSHY